MKMLSAEEMMEFRNEIADVAISDERKDDLIRYLDAIAASFVHQAFGKSAVQLSLTARANYAFIGITSHASLLTSDFSELVDLGSEGAINTKCPARQLAP